MSAATPPAKKSIYVDVDEEITGIIDKVRSTDESIIALVLPKRATVFQSIVNMKLLKRAANQSDKKVVLITSESSLLPLAGVAGLHVAANLQSRPYLPAPPTAPKPITEPQEIDTEEDAPIDPSTPVGVLAAKSKDKNSAAPIEIDNTPKETDAELAAASAATAAAGTTKKLKKDKSKKVPNFQKFRVLLFAGALALILLLIGSYWAFAIAPKATVTLRTESSETPVTAQFSADTDADEINTETKTVPALSKELKRNETEKVAATGSKDNGTKAGGTLTMRNCTDDAITVPAGAGVSNGDKTFITQSAVRLDSTIVKKNGVTQCQSDPGSVKIVAQQNGEGYNLTPRSYTISGYSNVTAQGDQMAGGTSKVVKVVAQSDVDSAKKRISDKQNAVVDELKTQLKDSGYVGLVDTFTTNAPALNPTPAVGVEAPEVTVSGEVTYSMLGVKEADLKKVIEDQSKDKVDTSKQTILNHGLADATYEVGAKRGSTTAITAKTTLVAGPEINQDTLKKELAGKKKNEVESTLKSRPGITEAKTEFKPFWVSKVPGKADKVTFVIEQADGKQINP